MRARRAPGGRKDLRGHGAPGALAAPPEGRVHGAVRVRRERREPRAQRGLEEDEGQRVRRAPQAPRRIPVNCPPRERRGPKAQRASRDDRASPATPPATTRAIATAGATWGAPRCPSPGRSKPLLGVPEPSRRRSSGRRACISALAVPSEKGAPWEPRACPEFPVLTESKGPKADPERRALPARRGLAGRAEMWARKALRGREDLRGHGAPGALAAPPEGRVHGAVRVRREGRGIPAPRTCRSARQRRLSGTVADGRRFQPERLPGTARAKGPKRRSRRTERRTKLWRNTGSSVRGIPGA